MKYQLVCTDVDGTLIGSDGRIPQENLDALRELTENRVQLAIATGRMLASARQMAAYYGISPYMVCSNGAVVAGPSGGILRGDFLAGETVGRICAIGEKYRCLMGFNMPDGVVYNGRDHFEDRLYHEANRLYGGGGHKIHVEYADGFQLPKGLGDVAKISMWAGSQKDFEAVWKEMEAAGDVCVTTAMKWNLELTAAGVSKWSGIRVLLEKFHLNAAQVLCLGDTMNDEEMIRQAGKGVCMGNGQKALKEAADYIADTNDNGGVAKVIRLCLDGKL